MRQEGAVVVFTIWHHESIVPDEFIGEVVLPLKEIKIVQKDNEILHLPNITMPILKSSRPKQGPFIVSDFPASYFSI